MRVAKLMNRVRNVPAKKASINNQRFRPEVYKGGVSYFEALDGKGVATTDNPMYRQSNRQVRASTTISASSRASNAAKQRLAKNAKDLLEGQSHKQAGRRMQRSQTNVSVIEKSTEGRSLSGKNLASEETKRDEEMQRARNLLSDNLSTSQKATIMSNSGMGRNMRPKAPQAGCARTVYSSIGSSPFLEREDLADYQSYKFSTLNLGEAEHKQAAVNMILCTLNPSVIRDEKLDLSHVQDKSIRRKPHALKYKRSSRSHQTAFTGAAGSIMEGGKKRATRLQREPSRASQISVGYMDQTDKYPLQPTALITPELRQVVSDFVDAVAAQYTSTQYHGFKHAVDVTQMMFMLGYYLQEVLADIHPFILIVTSLCHDIGHFGANNEFLRSDLLKKNEFIEKFSKVSSLERFHVTRMKEVVRNSKLFSKDFMHPSVRDSFCDLSEKLVLATDMEKHDKYIEEINEEITKQLQMKDRYRKSTADSASAGGTVDAGSVPLPFLYLAMKLCDIANVSREFADAKEWTTLLSLEFKAMGQFYESKESGSITKQNQAAIAENEGPAFVVADQLTSQCLIDFQKHVGNPDLAYCGRLTLTFMVKCAIPMAKQLMRIQGQAGWFLIDKMYQNMQHWEYVILEAEKDCPNKS